MNNTKIEWTNKTWNPVTGCTKVSQGCKNCYAETFYERFHGRGSFKNVICHHDRLTIPLKWKTPSLVFVNSMSDLFHESVPFEFIRAVFGVMGVCFSHTFQILTKRADRMLAFFEWIDVEDRDPADDAYDLCLKYNIETGCGSAFETAKWPLPNVWLGVSVEDQKTADERIPLLLQTPAAIRFLSCEPLLDRVDLSTIKAEGDAEYPETKYWFDAFLPGGAYSVEYPDSTFDVVDGPLRSAIDWVICGGESGHRARPMHPDWARSLRDQCEAADVPFFFKQWGEFTGTNKVGKKRAGRLLDGVEYNEIPHKPPLC